MNRNELYHLFNDSFCDCHVSSTVAAITIQGRVTLDQIKEIEENFPDLEVEYIDLDPKRAIRAVQLYF